MTFTIIEKPNNQILLPMKTKWFFLFLFCFSAFNAKAQETSRFSSIGLYYSISNLTNVGNVLQIRRETLIPWGLGVKIEYKLTELVNCDFGIVAKYSGENIFSGQVLGKVGPNEYSGPFQITMNDFYVDIPLHFNLNVINSNPFRFSVSTGPIEKIAYSIDHGDPDTDGTEKTYTRLGFTTGMTFGTVESIKIKGDFRFFASQYYGYYFIGEYVKFNSFDLNFGVSYKFKK
jgi:hypothetical protein